VDVLNQLVGGLQEQAGNLRAAALVADVRAGTSDAVRVELEHRDGQAIRALLPYKRKRLRRGIDYGELVAAPGGQRFWPGGEANPGF
jgi:class 3 adenylate cyclase